MKYLFHSLCMLLLAGGCRPLPEQRVVVYCALDQEFAAPVLDAFRSLHQDVPLAKYDIESTKSVGLAQAILAERARPRCDVFWNNEVLNTLRLERAGLLRRLPSSWLAPFPVQYRSQDGCWCGFAARARVLIVNTEMVRDHQAPDSTRDLLNPTWRHRVGMARPLFGTTATQAAVWHATWGPAESREFFRSLRENVRVMSGNRQVAMAVARGELAWGLTDTDDAWGAIRNGYPVRVIYPDQGVGQSGTLFIPNTVAILKDAPHASAAESLAQFLLSSRVEQALAEGPSGQIALRDLPPEPWDGIAGVRPMAVDFDQAADAASEIWQWLRDEGW